jgi:muramoyltetrapeptide carboxypeptidase
MTSRITSHQVRGKKMNVIKPPALCPNATIGIIAPAGPVNKRKLARGINYFTRQGYRVVLGRHIYRKWGYLAGTDQQRADDINRMFADKRINAIICARGGYGTMRLLDLLDYRAIARNPKILMGFSDITALGLAIWARTGLVTFSGPMASIDFKKGMDQFTERNVWAMLSGQAGADHVFERKSTWNVLKKGSARGRLLGGCLSLVHPLIGTKYQPDYTGALMFIEDVKEDPYHIDRAFQHLKHAGILQQVAGLVIGKMTKCVAGKGPTLSWQEVVADVVQYVNGPVVTNVDFGHTPGKLTVPVGVGGEIDTAKKIFKISEKPVV